MVIAQVCVCAVGGGGRRADISVLAPIIAVLGRRQCTADRARGDASGIIALACVWAGGCGGGAAVAIAVAIAIVGVVSPSPDP